MRQTREECLQTIDALTQKIQSEPDNEQAYFERGKCYYEIGSINGVIPTYPDAIRDFESVIQRNPDHIEAYKYRGWCYLALNQWEDYDPDEVLATIEELSSKIEQEPEEVKPYHYLHRGRYYLKLNRYAEALQDFEKVIILDPGPRMVEYFDISFDISAASQCELDYDEARAHIEAIEKYSQRIAMDSENSERYLERGDYYYEIKHYSEALEDYLTAIELAPENWKVYLEIAEGYKIPEGSIAMYSKLIELNPENAELYNDRGLCFIQAMTGHTEDALKDFMKAIEIDPQRVDAYYFLGCWCYETLGDYEKAVETYTAFIESGASWSFEDPYEVRAECYETLGKYQEAIEDYTELLSSQDRYPDKSCYHLTDKYRYNLKRGICYYKKGDHHNALEDLRLIRKNLEETLKQKDYKKSILSETVLAEFMAEVEIGFFLEAMSVLFDRYLWELEAQWGEIRKLTELWDRFDPQTLPEKEFCKSYAEITGKSYEKPQEMYQRLKHEWERDGKEIWGIDRKLELLREISMIVSREISDSSGKELHKILPDSNFIRRINQQTDLTTLQLNLKEEKLKRYKAIAEEKIEERNRLLQNFSHNMKNTFIKAKAPLENLKREHERTHTEVPQEIDNSMKQIEKIEKVAHSINFSFKGSVSDILYDVHHHHDGTHLKALMIEALETAVENILDTSGMYSNFASRYFNLKQKKDVRQQFYQRCGNHDFTSFHQFFETYFFPLSINVDAAENFVLGDTRHSATKFSLLFDELLFNAVKYTSLVERENRFINISLLTKQSTIIFTVQNAFNPHNKEEKTTGIGHHIVQNLVSTMEGTYRKNTENGMYTITIHIRNFWGDENDEKDSVY